MGGTSKEFNFIEHFISLLIEANLNQSEEDSLQEIKNENDNEFNKFISFIRQQRVEIKSELKRSEISWAKKTIEEMIAKAGGLKSIIDSHFSNENKEEVFALFRKYEKMSDADKESLLKNKMLIEFLQKNQGSHPLNNDKS